MNMPQVKKVIDEIRSRVGDTFFSVEFIKKDGSLRKMVARLGVKKGVKGVGLAYNPTDYKLLCAYDVQKQGFRMISIDKIQTIKIRGNRIEDIAELI